MSNGQGHHRGEPDAPEGGWICFAQDNPRIEGGDDFVDTLISGSDLEELPSSGTITVRITPKTISCYW